MFNKYFINNLINNLFKYTDYIGFINFAKDGIKIKESNKGKFTNYCKGKVTQECINKGKHSSDPKIRKRAVFAENARKWVKKGANGMFVSYTPDKIDNELDDELDDEISLDDLFKITPTNILDIVRHNSKLKISNDEEPNNPDEQLFTISELPEIRLRLVIVLQDLLINEQLNLLKSNLLINELLKSKLLNLLINNLLRNNFSKQNFSNNTWDLEYWSDNWSDTKTAKNSTINIPWTKSGDAHLIEAEELMGFTDKGKADNNGLYSDYAQYYITHGGRYWSNSLNLFIQWGNGGKTNGSNKLFNGRCSSGALMALKLMGVEGITDADIARGTYQSLDQGRAGSGGAANAMSNRLLQLGFVLLHDNFDARAYSGRPGAKPMTSVEKNYKPLNGDVAYWGGNYGKYHLATYVNGKWISDAVLNKLSTYANVPEEKIKIFRYKGKKKDEKITGNRKFKKGQYYEFISQLYPLYYDALLKKGYSSNDSDRIASMISMQDAFESGYGTSERSARGNYGGYMTNKDYGTMSDWVNFKLSEYDKKWPEIYNALNLTDFYDAIVTNNGYGVYTTDPRDKYLSGLNGVKNRVNSNIEKYKLKNMPTGKLGIKLIKNIHLIKKYAFN